MFFIKFIIYILIFSSSTYIGILISKQYKNRVSELNEFKIMLNTLKTKIRFTNQTLQDIFYDLSSHSKGNIANLLKKISLKLNTYNATYSWESSIEECYLCLTKDDKQILKSMGFLLGKTDLEGQLNEIELTEALLETQISEAKKEKEKNEKLYKTLGMITGAGLVIILI